MFEDAEVLAERLLAVPTGPAVGGTELFPDLDPDGSWTDRLVRLERVKAAAEAEQMTILAGMRAWAQDWLDRDDARIRATTTTPAERMSEKHGRPCAEELVANEIAPALRLSPLTAAARVDRATRIIRRLPGTLAALRAGQLDLLRVLAIDSATGPLDDPTAALVEQQVLPGAVDQTAPELRAALGKAVIAVDPTGAELRRKKAVKQRCVERYARDDGMSVIAATLSAVDTGEIYDLVDELARRTKITDDTRTADQRRADAYVHLLLGRDPHVGPDEPSAPPPRDPPAGPEDGPPDPADHHAHRPDDVSYPADDTQPGDRDIDVDVALGDGPEDVRPADDIVGADAGRSPRGDREPSRRLTGVAPTGRAEIDDPGMPQPADLDERFPPEPDRISELAALALSAMISRRSPRLPWVAINRAAGPNGTVVTVGELQGYGAITVEHARYLLAVGAARPPDEVSTRETTHAQARTHDPPIWLDRETRARDGTCRSPGCRRPAHRVDVDHTIPFPRGLTVRHNLGGLCRRHHRTKTAGAWHLEQAPDGHGTMTWTSRLSGNRYITYPRGTTGDWNGTTG